MRLRLHLFFTAPTLPNHILGLSAYHLFTSRNNFVDAFGFRFLLTQGIHLALSGLWYRFDVRNDTLRHTTAPHYTTVAKTSVRDSCGPQARIPHLLHVCMHHQRKNTAEGYDMPVSLGWCFGRAAQVRKQARCLALRQSEEHPCTSRAANSS